LNDGEDGLKTKSTGSKPLRYILFIGNVSAAPPLPLTMTTDRARASSKGNLKYTMTCEVIQKHFVLCGAFSLLPPFQKVFTKKKAALPVQAHPRRYAYLPPKLHVLAVRQPAVSRRQVQVQRLRIPRALNTARAASSPTLTPV
jgi:hypothetical protein